MELAAHTRPTMYADRAKKPIPAVHATMVAKAKLKKRKIRLIKAAELEGEGLEDLTEKQWVEKANMALELMVAQEEEKPNRTCFVGEQREGGERSDLQDEFWRGGGVDQRQKSDGSIPGKDGVNGGLQSPYL